MVMLRKPKNIIKMLAFLKRDNPSKDFNYVVNKPRKPKLCFGTTLERSCQVGFGKTEKQGPSLIWPIEQFSKPVSIRGTVLGGRTADRFPAPSLIQTPPPGAYSPKESVFKGAVAFQSSPRFPIDSKRTTAGPGYYKAQYQPKSLQYSHSLGGGRKLIPAVRTKCVPINTDTCDKCKSLPVGDYWQMIDKWGILRKGGEQDTYYLCRKCYEKERKRPRTFTKRQMPHFKKVRDCSRIHFHDGCDARILLLPPREIEKIQEKEAYLSLYFR